MKSLALGMMTWMLLCSATLLPAQETSGVSPQQLAAAREKALEFLKTSQREDGSWTSSEAPGVTGLVTFGLLAGGCPADDPAIEKAIKHLLTFTQPDGGIYFPKTHHGNYETAITMMVLSAANSNGQYADALSKAEKHVRGLQWDESEKIDKSDVKFGGAGYGRTGDRPDLSNTVFFLEALQATGAKSDDPAVQNALVFLSRCQNLETEFNTTPFPAKVNDGGFYYTPAAGGNSQAGNTPEGGLRSYGSMTYAGLKSMVYAGLNKDDPRVKAATDWIRKFYTVEENPGLSQQGVYYYYQMFAKALSTLEVDEFEDAAGQKHDWRKELSGELISRQQANGSWVNENSRWMEGDPNLATAYALMALKYTSPLPMKK
ncbi:hypothetical protein GC163_22475 [bacterium]|nr:hypothetical protein [bacterium]